MDSNLSDGFWVINEEPDFSQTKSHKNISTFIFKEKITYELITFLREPSKLHSWILLT